ncbi:hypothetical protein D3C86_1642540 [compost metagenome]
MMRLTHDDKVLSPDDVCRIGRVEIGGIDDSSGDPLLIENGRFLTGKGKGIRPKDCALAQISPFCVQHIGKGEIDVVFATAHP